ncbi:hypothetical protein PTSG_07043 [Salpingoeca rosetta]|uniref:cholesterol 7-desaturase n=1 Tax=Salpingoeca rosetta (strain ATCC 50818 / BSB-021) TaxID=946362 RepID=F2UDW0_SALR5|nr:uncharacterized protein PTSG_07043 [Salpingoeca rosetta]EGD74810.1 hypothetical protein PTSG_07043 [Salpingoeca rosetta]|eukprot:XP_004992455.1 hypothetical protein PTSG_07043 [Salpingoeca rosetta]
MGVQQKRTRVCTHCLFTGVHCLPKLTHDTALAWTDCTARRNGKMGVVTTAVAQLADMLPQSETVQREWEAVVGEAGVVVDTVMGSRLLFWTVVLTAVYLVYRLLFVPARYRRRMHDVGYLMEPDQSRVERANEVRRRRLTGDLPPVYPNGWFQLCFSRDLKPGSAKQVHILGKEFAVFRTESGKVGCLDAYCTHLGANLAAGGMVVGETLHCPFHGWKFNCEGKCTDIPYSKSKIPEQAHTTSYHVHEVNGHVLLWFDAEDRDPTWYPPELKKINNGWWWSGFTRHYLNCHIQEVPENGADVAHLHYLHGPGLLSGTDLRDTHSSRFEFVKHNWYASWAPVEEPGKKHLSVLNLVHRLSIFGHELPVMDIKLTATQVGPGLVYLEWSSFFGTGVFVQTLTPVEPLYQELTHTIYSSFTVPQIVSKFYLIGEAKQVERDVMVWNNKMYRKNPVLVKEDKLIAQHRRWYSQFYSENSPTLSFKKDDDLSW